MQNYCYNTPEYMRRNNCCGQQEMKPAPQACRVPVPAKAPCCDEKTACDALAGMPIAMAYVPWQKWCDIYEVRKALCCGTIFEQLNKPFKGIGGCCNGR